MRRQPNLATLGHTQRRVLLTMADGEARAVTDWGAWYPLNEGQVRGAMTRLGQRGLVDVAGWSRDGHGRARTFCLTERGRELAKLIVEEEVRDENDDRT